MSTHKILYLKPKHIIHCSNFIYFSVGGESEQDTINETIFMQANMYENTVWIRYTS